MGRKRHLWDFKTCIPRGCGARTTTAPRNTTHLKFGFCDLSSSDWDDVVVTKAGMDVTLQCTDTAVRGPVNVNWKVQLPGTDNWRLVLLASDRTGFSGSSLKSSMQLVDANFRDTGIFSLSLQPEREDGGFYSCLIEQQQKRLKERIILLAILTGSKISALLHQKRPSTVPSPHDLTINALYVFTGLQSLWPLPVRFPREAPCGSSPVFIQTLLPARSTG